MSDQKSILDHLKTSLGIMSDVVHFDDELIQHANLVFIPLDQLGVGPDGGFSLKDKDQLWSTYSSDVNLVSMLQGYLYMNVRLTFDSPTNSFLVESLKSQIEQLQWRLSVYSDDKELVPDDDYLLELHAASIDLMEYSEWLKTKGGCQ